MINWLRPRCPVDQGAKRWTEDRLGWLLAQFGTQRLRDSNVIIPTRDFFPDLYDNSESAARALFARVCGFMGIAPSEVELEFYQPTHRPGFARSLVRSSLSWAGQFERRHRQNLVRVDVTLLPLPESLIAVFSHELAHQLLLGEGRICELDRDRELVTDLSTVFFGLGVFNANECLRNRFRLNRRGDEVGRMGYLTPPTWSYALAVWCWLRRDDGSKWAKWLRPPLRRVFRRSLSYLARTAEVRVIEGIGLNESDRFELLKTEYPELVYEEQVRRALTHEDEGEPCADEPFADPTDADPTVADPILLVAEASQFMEDEEWGKAIDCLNAAISIEPDNGTAYQQRAWVLLELGRLDDALSDAEAAVHLEPDDSESFRARGAAYVKAGRYEQAVADLTRYLVEEDTSRAAGHRSSRGYYLRGLAYTGLREFREAIKDYGRAINRWPDWPEPYEARALAYGTIGKTKRAEADRQEARRRAAP